MLLISACTQSTKQESTESKTEKPEQAAESFRMITDTIIQDSSFYYLYIEIPQFVGEAYTKHNQTIMALVPDYSESIAAYKEYVNEATEGEYDFEPMPANFNTGYEIITDSISFLSVILHNYEYTGGAHGAHYTSVANIDLETGKVIPINRYFQNTDSLKQSLFHEINRVVRSPELGCWGFESLDKVDQILSKTVVTKDSLIVFFNDYDVCPYATGNPPVSIPRK